MTNRSSLTEGPGNRSDRRDFLRFLAASPLVPVGFSPGLLDRLLRGGRHPLRSLEGVLQDPEITNPNQALDVFDFEPVARKKIPPAHWAYLATGVDDDSTIRVNREGFDRFGLRPRRLRDISTLDTSVHVLGSSWETPIFLCPVSSLKAFHAEGEVAVARAARTTNHLQILSTVATTSIEDTIRERGAPVWFQLYPTDDWAVATAMVKRAERAGSPALVLTVDLQDGSNRETQARGARLDDRPCAACHQPGLASSLRRKPMFDSLDLSRATGYHPKDLSWKTVEKLRRTTSMKLVLKGIVTEDDAAVAVQHGVDAIIVSNHGGRAENSNRSTIECLPEVVRGTRGRIPVLIDSGFRRGTDIFKALALGASGVGVGRPYAWGLGAFGQPGVEAVLTILRRELETVMRQCGTRSIREITRPFVITRFS